MDAMILVKAMEHQKVQLLEFILKMTVALIVILDAQHIAPDVLVIVPV